jgi:hypothetical protein
MKTNVSFDTIIKLYFLKIIILSILTIKTDMISDNDPLISKYISVPKELSELNCNSFLAGIVEAILDGAQFVSYFFFSLINFLFLNI